MPGSQFQLNTGHEKNITVFACRGGFACPLLLRGAGGSVTIFKYHEYYD